MERGVVEFLTLDGRDMSRARDSMKKYKDLPMDLADAARGKIRRIFTLDRRDFEIYRRAKLGRFIILPE